MANPGYLASFEEGSYAQQAAASADAAAAMPHDLVPPPIDLSPDFVQAQQARFRGLMDEGRPGAGTIHGIYVEDEKLQQTASISYDEFVSSARLATSSVVRYDALSASINPDGDVASNFVLDKDTQAVTKDALQDVGADQAATSLATAMRTCGRTRTALVTASKKVKGQALKAAAAEEALAVEADELAAAAIEEKIGKVEKIGAVIDLGVGAVTGGGVTSLADAKDALLTTDNGKDAVAKGSELAGLEVDPTSVAGVAAIGARLYYAEEIAELKTQIAAGKKAIASLSETAEKADLEALFEELDQALVAHQDASLAAQNAMDDRRKQYAKAGRQVDAEGARGKDARSSGADEGEVSESLLLGSAAEEAALFVSVGKDAGAAAASAVADAYRNARTRDDTSYQTADDTSELNGNDVYLTRGRFENLADDPDVQSLYTMSKAIERWQKAADQAESHLAGVTGSFRDNITTPAGHKEY